jgi:hypothetical protein
MIDKARAARGQRHQAQGLAQQGALVLHLGRGAVAAEFGKAQAPFADGDRRGGDG